MRKFISVFCALVILAAIAAVVYAASPVSTAVTMGTTTGTGSLTVDAGMFVQKLVSIEVFNNLNATNVVTVKRVRSGRTNTVCAITCAAGTGKYAEITNSIYLFTGDVLNFTSMVATGGVAEVTCEEVQ